MGALTALTALKKIEYWPPLFSAFEAANKDGAPAIKLSLTHPDASITGDTNNDKFIIRTPDELRNEVRQLRNDINNLFNGELDPKGDPDVTLMQRALDSLA